MCGIVGYIGYRNAAPILIEGLKRLEYRGYDSAGIALLNGKLEIHKRKGKVAELEASLPSSLLQATMGIGHTRWATHGIPNDINAHPHTSGDGTIAIIHNGIIENYAAIRAELLRKGHQFKGETDTEVLAHLIEEVQREVDCDLETAVRLALREVVGTYGLCIISTREPDKLIVARNGSPLLIGIGEGEHFVGSDASPVVGYTRKVIYLSDGEIATLTRNSCSVKTIENIELPKPIEELTISISEIEKGGYEHFMLKEIYEQPDSILNCMRGRVLSEENAIRLGGLREHLDKLRAAPRIIICACGTSWHAGLVGERLIEDLARIPVEVEYASEFRYRNPIIREGDVVIVISQSGETADTLAALREAKARGALVVGVCNVVGSTIARETHCGVYTHAGPEIGVASTKAFTAQVTVLALIALSLGHRRTLSDAEVKTFITELLQLPQKVQQILSQNELIVKIADTFKDARNFLYLGRGYNFPVALEGALKLKEISYIHAEGYPAAEMKHGPIALIDENMPVVFIATKDAIYHKVISNIEEVRSRKGRVIAIATEGDDAINHLAEFVIRVPETLDALLPILTVIPLQLLAYHIAVMRGCNVDQPRNLAKSVTVE
ncbi:MAG: glutamine--fructose-6-phosphate transaminase (isomerizing) [Chloroherpetonaceae bacterium]|nr:glutamine--fructose-6-phosphate transaminase (isomerizing) [Chloroherpetonaceae bacterium]MCS7212217.1 glutamine--fructose-6-phosphate transaminase (isomerizing) [Chloroherpetonaceae bacterium]MDW8019784.1 glutamine--fructose-6-phosphate transaminase (isomerizing) [Chloroherpetonaceae bacterium]MDW8465278.1 glutamine--fructose-6-phosphate transaminase (isomerizing) [Chloroherpetonaceae bacterium]